MKQHAVFLMGPTASGKTAAALAVASQFPVEIVSVDSALVYRDMDIGTAKPTATELASCPQHLINIVSPEESYSAAQFRSDALTLINEICRRGRTPILVGGTMLYFKALHDGLSDLPQADGALREEIEQAAREKGWPALHTDLAELDPEAAARLNPNDAQRIQRALEIVRLSGQSLAENYNKRSPLDETPLPFLRIALEPSDRAVLHERIAQRFDAMLTAGFEQEVRKLLTQYTLSPNMASMRCVGYRQMWEYINGEIDFEQMRFKGIAATRQLAKRQITWMRQFKQTWPEVQTVDCLQPDHQAQILEQVSHWALQQQ
ncbi:tRNA (adenosine(37)-N6)-dimethylallyltransferase MiaA [Uliginosibacterium gangwonense]|uniref:tRNA (adenosine(37)-N6)-dimethylallyltransferase MiaA n=1 Tax=Uliginosibacterium gangwonense TaxID=392736 RepID=UPI00039A67BA|nr:tRNA (adenosine(37)-N6)-dimethylallyltransferase MiaA [Uliginosibacterium gangwonense]